MEHQLRLVIIAAVALLLGACTTTAETHLPLGNDTPLTLRVRVLDRTAAGDQRQRRIELPPGSSIALGLRFGRLATEPARLEARSLDAGYFRAREIHPRDIAALRNNGGVRFAPDPADAAAIQGGLALALQPIAQNLAAGKPALADEVDPAGGPAAAVDGDVRTYWRGMTPPAHGLVSWTVDLGAPATVDRVQIDVECVTCGPVRLRVLLLDRPLPPATYSPTGVAQSASIVTALDRMPDAILSRVELSGSVANGDRLGAAPAAQTSRVRAVVVTILEAPENIGLYELRLSGSFE